MIYGLFKNKKRSAEIGIRHFENQHLLRRYTRGETLAAQLAKYAYFGLTDRWMQITRTAHIS
ncbi:MAG: hypothetical protein LBH74_00890 [Nitrososphaerota archaeon]|jgi:hypothetical protein|nr:hypothetical protein [Nitrososphaerota archaeon]